MRFVSASAVFRSQNLRKHLRIEVAQYKLEASMIDGGDINDDKAPHRRPATVQRCSMTATL